MVKVSGTLTVTALQLTAISFIKIREAFYQKNYFNKMDGGLLLAQNNKPFALYFIN